MENFNRSGKTFDELENFMNPCRTDLSEFQGKLATFQSSPGDGMRDKIRKGVGIMLREADFVDMDRKISHYIDVLGVRVGIIGT
jgi:hypothetical protein